MDTLKRLKGVFLTACVALPGCASYHGESNNPNAMIVAIHNKYMDVDATQEQKDAQIALIRDYAHQCYVGAKDQLSGLPESVFTQSLIGAIFGALGLWGGATVGFKNVDGGAYAEYGGIASGANNVPYGALLHSQAVVEVVASCVKDFSHMHPKGKANLDGWSINPALVRANGKFN